MFIAAISTMKFHSNRRPAVADGPINSAGFDADRVAHELSERGLAWADAHAAAEALEETKKSMLAQISLASDHKSQTVREEMALASPEYREHVTKMVEARRAANRARVRFDTYKAWIELKRTAAATERAAMNLR